MFLDNLGMAKPLVLTAEGDGVETLPSDACPRRLTINLGVERLKVGPPIDPLDRLVALGFDRASRVSESRPRNRNGRI